MGRIGAGFPEIDYITKIDILNNDIAFTYHYFDTWYMQKPLWKNLIWLRSTHLS